MTKINELVNQFNYGDMDIETREFLKQKETAIDTRNNMVAQLIVENGRDLIEVKERLGHGLFMKWVEVKYTWSQATVNKMIQVYEKFGNSSNSRNLNFAKETLFLLAQDSTPESAREEALECAEAGEKLTVKETKELIAAHKQKDQFDYSAYDAETQEILKQKTAEIKAIRENTIAENRKFLTQMRETLGDKQFREYMKKGYRELIKDSSRELGLPDDDLFFFVDFFLPEEFREFMPDQTQTA